MTEPPSVWLLEIKPEFPERIASAALNKPSLTPSRAGITGVHQHTWLPCRCWDYRGAPPCLVPVVRLVNSTKENGSKLKL